MEDFAKYPAPIVRPLEQPLPLSQLPLSPERTFGFGAVAKANTHAAAIEAMTLSNPQGEDYLRHESFVGYWEGEISRELAIARTALQAMGPEVDQPLDDEYLNIAIPRYLLNMIISDQKERGVAEIPWREWLVEDDGRLLNFLQWHNHIIEQQSESEEVRNSFRVYKHRFLVAAHKLYENDQFALPPKEIDDASLVVGDIFGTTLKEVGGYYQPGKTEVVVNQGKGRRPEDRIASFKAEFSRVLVHEFVHLYLNRSLDTSESGVTARWFNEALTESIARNIRKEMGEFDESDNTYFVERRLLRLLVSKSPNQDATIKLATKAFTGNEQDQKIFTLHIDALWGARDVLEKIEEAIVNEEKRLTELGGGKRSRSIEAEAVNGIRMQLKDDPETILWAKSDEVLQNNGKLAQQK